MLLVSARLRLPHRVGVGVYRGASRVRAQAKWPRPPWTPRYRPIPPVHVTRRNVFLDLQFTARRRLSFRNSAARTMYNSYQGGPPPGLSQQQQGGSGQNRQPTPGSGSGQWHHHPAQRAQQQQQAGGQAASAAASSGAAAPGRSSAAIPIMRPDGSATTSATTSAATTPTLKKSAPASAATSPRPAPGGLSRAAGAAVFVPKSSNKGNDEGKVGAGAATGGNSNGSAGGGSAGGGATAPTGEFRAMNVNGGGSEAPSASTSAYPSPALNPYARAASGAGSAIFTPASGRGTPTATGYESASGAAGGGGADAMVG